MGGDGRTNFGLPDMRGRIPLHYGQGSGLSNRKQGDKGGAENHALKLAEMSQHQHALNASTGEADQKTPKGNLLGNQGRKKQNLCPRSGRLSDSHA